MKSNVSTNYIKRMAANNKHALQFALAGLLIALVLQLVGYLLDHAAPRLTLENQVLYNWLTLVLSPVAFFLRLGDADGPIVAGWTTFLITLFTNALLYAVFCGVCQALLLRLRIKLAHENIPVVAQLHPERVIRLASPNWRPRRV